MRRAVHRGLACNVAATGHRSLTSSAARRTVAALPAASTEADSLPRPSSFLGAGAAAVLFLTGVYAWNLPPQKPQPPHLGSDTTLSNWSNTHEVSTQNYHQPESLAELEALVAHAQKHRLKLRPVGSGLSPNGLGFNPAGMVNMALCDKVLHVDPVLGRVTLQAGARLEVALRALKEHGWTLQNFSSIAEQQVGGWTQAGCHGTGASLPPVEEQVVSLKLVTPGKGTLVLDGHENNPELFHLAKVGLGALGVVAEVTLQGVKAHSLGEQVQVMPASQVGKGHAARLQKHRHVRYMWLPYTDDVVVVTADPLERCPHGVATTKLAPEVERTAALRALLRRYDPKAAADEGLSFADLRDKALAVNPLSVAHVAEVNTAEAAFWKASQGWRVGDSAAILGFECGGEQWVTEVAFPTGTRARPDGRDLRFVQETLAYIRAAGIPAPAPLEQRWSCGSAAPMSPAFTGHTESPGDALHCWLGIIMYLPPSSGPGSDPERRAEVDKAFAGYRQGWQKTVCSAYGAADHWAKIELPATEAELMALRKQLRLRFPVETFTRWRQELDPDNVMGSDLIDALMPRTRSFTGSPLPAASGGPATLKA